MPLRPTLVLLPGQLCDAALWTAQNIALSADCVVVVADLTLDDSIPAMADRILRQFPEDRTLSVCGLSLGGYVALEIVRRAPERVARLALFNTSARADSEERSEARERSVRAARIGTFKGVTARALSGIIHPDHANNPAIAEVVLAMTERVGRVAFERQQMAAILRADCRSLLPYVSCPTLIIGGRQDRVAPPTLQEELGAGIPRSALYILEKCGHLAPLEQPETVTCLMRAWLFEQLAA